jgi:uncharacterized membrane protein
MREWLLNSLRESARALLSAHPALIVSAFYIAASVIGMFYSWAFLREFDINVFNYTQISDFLMASLKEPFTWVIVTLSVFAVATDNMMSRRFGSKPRSRWIAWYGTSAYRSCNDFVAVIMVFIFLYVFATASARDARDGEGKIVDVLFADSGAATSALLLGTTGQFVFLYDDQTERVDVHPIENIHSISFSASRED